VVSLGVLFLDYGKCLPVKGRFLSASCLPHLPYPPALPVVARSSPCHSRPVSAYGVNSGGNPGGKGWLDCRVKPDNDNNMYFLPHPLCPPRCYLFPPCRPRITRGLALECYPTPTRGGLRLSLTLFYGFSLSCGNNITSLIDCWLVRSITRRSMPTPRPPVGGIPYSSASR